MIPQDEQMRLAQAIAEEEKRSRPALRDRFAMAALTGIVGNSDSGLELMSPEAVADCAYALADAMIERRNWTPPEPCPVCGSTEEHVHVVEFPEHG